MKTQYQVSCCFREGRACSLYSFGLTAPTMEELMQKVGQEMVKAAADGFKFVEFYNFTVTRKCRKNISINLSA